MIAMEDYFSQHELGLLLSDEHFSRGSETFRNRLKEPGLRAYWMKERTLLAKAAPGYCPYRQPLHWRNDAVSTRLDIKVVKHQRR
jgi:hypothetical protein